MRKCLTLLYIVILATTVFAASGSVYRSSPEGLFPAGGTADSVAYVVQSAVGEDFTGITSSTAYDLKVGFMASSVSFASQEAGIPILSSLRFDGRAIVPGDYVNKDVTITAVVTDTASTIDTAASTIEINATVITFASLSGESSFNPATGLITYKPSPDFDTDTYALRITAVNVLGNSATGTGAFKVDSGAADVIGGGALPYPNPFDPDQGAAEIGYQLSADANVSIYIFNSVGQRIWKSEYSAGSNGGRAGYNFVTWDGMSDFGSVVGNDVYFIRVISGGKVIGRGKIAVVK